MNILRNKKVLLALSIIVILWYALFVAVFAGIIAFIKGNVQAGEIINIKSAQSSDFAALGETVNVNSNLDRKMFIAGETININSLLKNDVVLLGEDLQINKSLEGNAFLAGNNLVVSEDANLAQESWVLASDVRVDGNFLGKSYISAENIRINGDAVEALSLTAEKVVIDGKISGELKVKANTLEFTENSEVANLKYDVENLIVQNGALIDSKVQFDFEESDLLPEVLIETEVPNNFQSDFIFGLIFTSILFYFFRRKLATAKDLVINDPKNVLKQGIILQFGAIALIILLFVTIIGIPMSILLMIALSIAWAFVLPFSAIMLTHYAKEKLVERKFSLPMPIIFLASYTIVSLAFYFIPFGGFIEFVAGLFVLGSVYMVLNGVKEKSEVIAS